MIWHDRIVLPDGTVILPEQVVELYVVLSSVVIHTEDGSEEERDLRHARIDRCTDMRDQNKVMIYEWDKVINSKGKIGNVRQNPNGLWEILWNNYPDPDPLAGWCDIITITGRKANE